MGNIGFKTTAFKSENYTLQKATPVQEQNSKEDILMPYIFIHFIGTFFFTFGFH